jgi:hypothetical protein
MALQGAAGKAALSRPDAKVRVATEARPAAPLVVPARARVSF